ncbi:MAG: hypothetical protein B7X47_05720 [Ferrovum sp. 34-44-207]|nr:MAG: hypothetical protein B7X47_05720 [Ferrovum sp. 34-44-207]HQT82316.1 hypothetical protein [Ferrovaceae bacterium]HQU07334.1 hypothetical protein [Ferrovaceae bacterium]
MSFATPRPDMTNRLPKRMVLGGTGKKTARPPNGEPERIRTIAWFNAVAISLGEQRPGTIGRLMQKESDARGLSQNHDSSKRWNHYAKGMDKANKPVTLSKEIILLVDEVAPGTADVFRHGPGSLWPALWDDRIPRLYPDEIIELFSIDAGEIDATWLQKAIIAWRDRAALIRFGAFDHIIDGLYEAVFIGLHQHEIKAELTKLGVWEFVCNNVAASEKNNLDFDLRKRQEIEAIGNQFSCDPIRLYLTNPVGFAAAALKTNRTELNQ